MAGAASRHEPWSGNELKVLEVANFVAGPVAATLLGDFGADVIKIERPGTGDPMRHIPPGPPGEGMGYQWRIEGRNKRSITANLGTDKGCAVVRALAERADILIENSIPGSLSRRGLGYEDLRLINPRLVYVSISGFGHGNELSELPGYDYTGAAFSGLTNATGFRDRPPILPGYPLVDYSSATFAALGALEAVRRRDSVGGTGRGDWVDVALFEPMLRFSTPMIPMFLLDGNMRTREGSVPVPAEGDKPTSIFGYAYETDDDLFIAMSPAQVELTRHAQLMEIVGRPELADDPRLASYMDRKEHYIELDEAVRGWTRTRSANGATSTLRAAAIPCSVINSVREIVADPVIKQRVIEQVWDEETGSDFPMQGVLPHFADSPGTIRWPGERLGASNDDVYRGLLGWSEEELARAVADGVV
jgi:crotonobetainyl-CoA:carnitine CoA-transferase CaiB-like acyl-CoA transferase